MNKIWQLGALVSLLSLISCGGGNDVAGINAQDISGTGTSDATDGSVNGFGSIIVGGITFDTESAEVFVDGEPASESDIQLGYVVSILSTPIENNTATAQTVRYEALIEGPITALDAEEETIEVLGQAINEDNSTIVRHVDFDTIAVGDWLEVSGQYDSDNELQATYIGSIPVAARAEITGLVTAIEDNSINLGNLMINVEAVADLPSLEAGSFIEAIGSFNNDTLTAETITLRTLNNFAEGQRLRRDGYVLSVAEGRFNLNGLHVILSDTTTFTHGEASDLTVGAELYVSGTFNGEALVADSIEFEQEGELEIKGPVDAIFAADQQISILGITINVPSSTLVKDNLEELRTFNLSELNIGDFIEIYVAENDDNSLSSLVLEREEEDELAEIAGPATNINTVTATLSVFGVSIDLSNPELEIESDDNSITLEQFFEALNAGDTVEVEGLMEGSVFVAQSVEL